MTDQSVTEAAEAPREAAGKETGRPNGPRRFRLLRGTVHSRRELRVGLLLMAPAVIVTCLVMLWPMTVAVRDSLFSINTVTRSETFVGLDNYINLRSDGEFWAAMWRTLVWVVGAVGTQAVVGILIALALNKKVKGLNIVRGVVLFPYLVPAIVAVLTWRWILSGTVGVANYILVDLTHLLSKPVSWFHPSEPIPFTSWAMISIILMSLWKYAPYWALFILARLQSVPVELTEAALIDGAGPWQRFRYVTWPWIMPVVMVLVVLRSIWAFREFDMVYLPAYGGPLQRTTTIPVYIRHVAWDLPDIGKAAAVAIALLIFVILLNQVYLRIYERSEARLD